MTSPPDLGAWPTGRLLAMAARLVEHTWSERLAALDLTHAGLIALDLLQPGPKSQRGLASEARVQEQTMSRTVERLERAGFVSRETDPQDARRRLVTTTALGSSRWQEARTVEADLFPATADAAALRPALVALIGTLSTDRWPGGGA